MAGPRKTSSFSRRAWLGFGAAALAGAPNLFKSLRAQTPPKIYPLAASSLILDVAEAEGALVAVGDRGFILRSTDGGKTWPQTASPTAAMLTGIAMASPSVGVAVGHDATILRTVDGGQTWTLVESEPDLESPLLDVWFESAEHGFAVGAYGLLKETQDGGQTWEERRISDEEPHLYAAARTADGTLFVAGETGAMFKSADQGGTWSKVEASPYGGTYFGLLALHDGGLLAYGLRGNIFKSHDQGRTWTDVPVETTASLLGGVQRKSGGIYIVGLAGTVVTSIDGQSFQTTPLTDREALAGVFETANGQLLAFGEKGLRMLDAGTSA